MARERILTSRHGGTSRLRGPLVVAVLMVTIGALAGCESTPADRNEVIAHINASRQAAGLKPLREHITLDQKADRWAQTLRDRCDLSHSKLSDGAPPEWLKLGENVGYGGTIRQVHDAYMNSPGHRANILDPAFQWVGAAAVWGTCPDGTRRVFTVQVFMKS